MCIRTHKNDHIGMIITSIIIISGVFLIYNIYPKTTKEEHFCSG